MSSFKVGDSALVVGGNFLLGQGVELIKWVEPGDAWAVIRGVAHVLDPVAPAGAWLVRSGTITALKKERSLMPLRGGFRSCGAGVRRVSE